MILGPYTDKLRVLIGSQRVYYWNRATDPCWKSSGYCNHALDAQLKIQCLTDESSMLVESLSFRC